MNVYKFFLSDEKFRDRVLWLIKLRWVACAGLFLFITLTKWVLKIEIVLLPLYLGNLILLISNSIYYLSYSRLKGSEDSSGTKRALLFLAHVQISFDLFLLNYLIYFSGGIENPFIFYFIFNMAIASILLHNKAAYIHASITVVIVGIILGLECIRWIPHYHLAGYMPEGFELIDLKYFAGQYLAFVTTLYITVYLSTTIVNELRKRENELAKANVRLQEQDKIKSQYVMTVSHDIRGSLAAIQSLLQVVLYGYTDKVRGKSYEFIEQAEKRSETLLGFVKDLLDLSRLRASERMEKASTPVIQVIQEIVAQMDAKIKEKELIITYLYKTDKEIVRIDKEDLEHILLNLIGNAVRYTPPKGSISMELNHQEDDNRVQFIISDSGIGIPAKDLPHIFEDFYRASNAKNFEKNGTGLGFSIVKHIVESYEGTINVKSEPGEGTRFALALPSA